MKRTNTARAIDRRKFLQVTASGAVVATAVGSSSLLAGKAHASAYEDGFTWISPRGTLEVLDDYPYWVGKSLGYFGDLNTEMQPGPSDGTATVKFVAVDQADMGFPSPGVFSFAIENDMDLVSVYNMGAVDVFDFAVRPDSGITSLKDLEGKTIMLGSAAWQSITDPMLAAAGVDIKSIEYLEGGWPQWGTMMASGQGDAALAWEGLRAEWESQGLELKYLLGVDHSNFPANSFVVRRADLEDSEKRAFLEQYLRGWAMGMEFAHHNPRAATQAVFEQFPVVKNNFGAEGGTESLMQLANVFRGDMSKRDGWGDHDMDKWTLFFETLHEIGQISDPVDVSAVITNDFIGPANDFDHDKVKADAESFTLSDEMAAVDMAEIQDRFFANAIR